MSSKRFVLIIEDDAEEYTIDMPDGGIETDKLISVLDATIEHIIETIVNADEPEEDQPVEVKDIPDNKLN